MKSLIDEPCEEAFLLAAKAKPVGQKVLVESLARSSEWIEEEAARIARAALGAKAIEDEYLAFAVDTAAERRGSSPWPWDRWPSWALREA
ncbi:MAG: hypothetical protein MZV70_46980 [Desulfobacterales bacterium]|nr:hypothetical protein [Desulfobacterales bacterium]